MNEKRNPLLNYIAALEGVNAQLIATLRQCISLLAQFKDDVPDPEGWQAMIDAFEEAIEVGERVRPEGISLH